MKLYALITQKKKKAVIFNQSSEIWKIEYSYSFHFCNETELRLTRHVILFNTKNMRNHQLKKG